MSYLRTFVLLKDDGSGGPSGGRIVALGALMPSGNVVLEWTNGTGGIAVFQNVDALMAAHTGHNRAMIRWGNWDDDE